MYSTTCSHRAQYRVHSGGISSGVYLYQSLCFMSSMLMHESMSYIRYNIASDRRVVLLMVFHPTKMVIRLLAPMERREGEDASELCERAQVSLREELKLRKAEFTLDDITTWIDGQGRVRGCDRLVRCCIAFLSHAHAHTHTHTARKKRAPSSPAATSDPSPSPASALLSAADQVPDGIEKMVQQVSAVMPQVPCTAIRKDLCKVLMHIYPMMSLCCL